MKKLKTFFEKNVNDIKKSINNYPITHLFTLIITILYMIVNDNNFFKNNKIINDANILSFYTTTIFAFLLIEILINKWTYRIIGYTVSLIISTLFELIFNEKLHLFGAERLLVAYIVSLIFLILYFVFTKLKINSHKYLLDLFNNVFFYHLIFIIVDICFSAVIGIFMYLIIDDSPWYLLMRLQILLIGILYIPSMILAITKEKSNITLFIENILKFVLYPVTIIAMLIIYMYMVKILIFEETPANQIFGIVTGIFVCGYPVILMIRNYKTDNKFYTISSNIISWLFIPLIILQCYALILRVLQYGYTSTRYLAFFLLALEIVILMLSLYSKKDILEKSLLVAIILTIIVTISPFNFEKIGVLSQTNKLTNLMPKGTDYNNLSSTKQEQVNAICRYLGGEEKKYVNKYVPNYLKDIVNEKKNTITNIYVDKETDYAYESIYYNLYGQHINITKYSTATPFSADDYSNTSSKDKYADLLINLYKDNNGKVSEILIKNIIIKNFSKDQDLCITNLDATYRINEEKNIVEIDDYRIEGLLLKKDISSNKK